MTTKMLEQKTRKLEKEVALLKSFMIGYLGKDPEGEYKEEFVKSVLKAAKEKPIYTYNPKTFLRQIRGK